MHRFLTSTTFILISTLSAAVAADWTGQTATPLLNGPVGTFPFPTSADGSQLITTPTIVICNGTAAPPPCPAGQHLTYGLAGSASATPLPALPASAGAPGSNLGVAIFGGYYDPTSPTGISNINGTVPLSSFATSDSVSSLGTSVNGLGAQQQIFTTQINQMFQQLQQQQQLLMEQDRTARQGIAAALAMAGTGEIGPDEKVAVSMNWGYFGGQGGVAGGVAVRAAEHLTFNGGIAASVSGGPVGARGGVRFAW